MEKLARILYAEDSSDDIELTLAAFKEINMVNQIDIVRDGEEALDYLFYRGKYADRERCAPSFVLLDIKMPKLNGIEVLKLIRQSEEYASLPVVMLTSSQMEMDILRSYQLGANGYVIKPIDFPEFVKAIKGIGYFWAILNTSPSK
ncbi:MAG: response regulator [Bacteroidales bacterium]|nr:response regulator [Bacteroidales bacterium]